MLVALSAIMSAGICYGLCTALDYYTRDRIYWGINLFASIIAALANLLLHFVGGQL